MIKFIPQFSCWKLSESHALVIASCAKTHEVKVWLVQPDGILLEVLPEEKMPDVRLLIPCRFHALNHFQRAVIRAAFQRFLEERYGKEIYRSSFSVAGLDQ